MLDRPTITPNYWTVERVDALRKMWTEGLSASQIAHRLGAGLTRSAVCGKANRLRLDSRVFKDPVRRAAQIAGRMKAKAYAKPRSGVTLARKPMKVMAIPTLEPIPGRVTLVEVKECRWPVGDDKGVHLFCDAPRREGRPYCPFHDEKSVDANRKGRW